MNRDLALKIVESLAVRRVRDDVHGALREFDTDGWEKTLWWLSGSGLPHYFLARLQHSGREDTLPRGIHAKLSQNFSANHARVDAMAEEFDSLNRRLQNAGIQFAVVRGFELAPEYCSNLWLRTWYTHEYIVSAEEVRYASQIVEQTGYPLRRCGSRGERFFAVPEMQPPSNVEEAYSSAFPRMVVLHSKIWDRGDTGIDANMPMDVLQRLVTRRSHGISFPTLADEDLLAITLMDTFARVLNYWCKLSWLLEICHFLEVRQSDDMFWESFYRRIADCGRLPEIASFLFSLCASIFEPTLPEVVRYRISGLNPALVLWTRHYGRRWAIAEYPGSKLSLLVQRELVGDQGAWKQIRRRKLFPLSTRAAKASVGNAASTNSGESKRKILRAVDKIRFHGPATYAYLRELARWKRLLAQGS